MPIFQHKPYYFLVGIIIWLTPTIAYAEKISSLANETPAIMAMPIAAILAGSPATQPLAVRSLNYAANTMDEVLSTTIQRMAERQTREQHTLQTAFVEEVQDHSLADVRGTSGLTFSAEALGVAVLTGVAAHNSVQGGNTGNNNIADAAFSGTNGVSFVVQNTGNNAVVNAAMVVNLSISQ